MNLLDNIVWHALSGPQQRFSSGTATARRYATGFSPMVAFADCQQPDFEALAPWCGSGENFYCADWTGPPPPGWRVDVETTMHRMVWHGGLPEEPTPPFVSRPLQPKDADAALALATLTKPGPFGPRTIELGEYLGCFDAAGGLIAMAGERMHAPGLREVSGVCTHPGHQGTGLARKLMLQLLRRQMQRGEQPFLHVMASNTGALGLYERMGFRTYKVCPVRVVTRV